MEVIELLERMAIIKIIKRCYKNTFLNFLERKSTCEN